MTIRCAIYTRKSTDEGLDKEFNTLEAQREAGVNYVKSQMHQGWEVISKRYDDGGFSGGSIERPALRELLQDIENGEVNMIVVYKIDRLTRSLVDFSKLIEVLDRNHCSFVSVTQNFNTYDSMGRLTLNVLLSFAQFEREVITERVRDKIAASKRKGMWMGGNLPLGYDSHNKKLVINQKEAEIVRLAFERYLILRSELGVAEWLNDNGYTTMVKGKYSKFSHMRISMMLKNQLYIGKIVHKDKVYVGQHEPLISQEMFDKVQEIKTKNRAGRLAPSRFMEHALLKGYISCECCHSAMVSTKSNKKNRVYEYYTSVRAVKEGFKNCRVGSIPAATMDSFVLRNLEYILETPRVITELILQIKELRPDIQDIKVINKLKDTKDFMNFLSPITQRQLLELLVVKVRVNTDRIKIIYTPLAIKLMNKKMRQQLHANNMNGEENEILYRVGLCRRRGSMKIVSPESYKPNRDNPLFQALSKAFVWGDVMKSNNWCISDLAENEKLSREYVGKILRMPGWHRISLLP